MPFTGIIMKRAIPYYRVSTDKQGRSGLGLEAQKTSVQQFAKANHFDLGEEYIEVESGTKSNRAILGLALEACKAEKATLLIAKLDRLARNVAFISKLMESDVEFVAVDNPSAQKLIVHIMAAFAEHERDQISQRTKDALQAAKRNGKILGRHGSEVLSKLNKQSADVFALEMLYVFEGLKRDGHKTIRSLTNELNRKNIKTFSGGKARWHTNTVYCILKRMKKLNTDKT